MQETDEMREAEAKADYIHQALAPYVDAPNNESALRWIKECAEREMFDNDGLPILPWKPIEVDPISGEPDHPVEAMWRAGHDFEAQREYATGKEMCSECHMRTVVAKDVLTYGVQGHAGSEYSVYRRCENCHHSSL